MYVLASDKTSTCVLTVATTIGVYELGSVVIVVVVIMVDRLY